jgi:hypothetical protein
MSFCKSIKGHYETKHILQLSSLQGQSRKDKLNQLQKCLIQQQNLFKGAALQSDTAVYAIYVVSVIKECLSALADIAFPYNQDVITKISLS